MDISVVIPLFNEEESLPELFSWIKRVMNENHFTYEVFFVNDGSTDHSWQVIEQLTWCMALSSVATMARALPYSAALHVYRVMW